MAYGSLERGVFKTRSYYGSLIGRLKTERSSFDAHWKEISDWLLPRRSRFQASDRNRGDKRNQNIINSAGRFAHRTLASGLHAGLTSPARPWFKLSTPDPDLAEFGPVKEYLHIATMRMVNIFLTTNLYNALPVVYGDMGGFSTAAMAVLDDSKDLFRAYQYPIGSYMLGQDARGNATTFVREYEMSVRQLVTTFAVPHGTRQIDWSKVSTTVKDLWDKGDYEAPVQVTWIVMPNDDADESRLESKYLPWSSCYFETLGDNDKPETAFLRESGFRTFPIMAPRWDVTDNDTYGTSGPGMDCLGDIKQLQIMERRKGQAIAKMVDPPLAGPSALRSQKISLLPGDITYLDTREGMQGLKSIHDVNLDLDHLGNDIDRVVYRIQRGFYEDLFLMLASSDPSRGAQPITAREVQERHEEKLLALGPVLERTNDELLEPLIDRAWDLMEKAGLLPDAPPELDGVELKVEYLSIMAQAQKLVGLVGLDRFVGSLMPIAEVSPDVLDKVDMKRVVTNYGEMTGIDPRILRDDDEAAAMSAERNKQAAAQQSAMQMKDTADAVNKLGSTPVTGDSALSRLGSAVENAQSA